MITLKGSRFIVSYDENSGEHNVFVRNKDGYNDVTKTLDDEEKEELINDLIYCIADLINNRAENCGGGWIPCKDRLPEEDGIYWAVVTLPKPVENGYSFIEAEYWYENHTLEELCEWEKNATKHTGLIKFENGDWKPKTKRRFTKILMWQPIIELESHHES